MTFYNGILWYDYYFISLLHINYATSEFFNILHYGKHGTAMVFTTVSPGKYDITMFFQQAMCIITICIKKAFLICTK